MALALYTAAEVARVVGIRPGRLAYWVKTGLLAPSARRNGRGLFCFEDLVAVKAAAELVSRGVSLQAVRRNLRALRGALPPPDELIVEAARQEEGLDASSVALPPQPLRPRPLTRLRVVSDGEQLVVVEDDVAIEPLSGQVVMDFVVGSLASRAAEVLALPPPPPADDGHERAGWEWLAEALRLEDEGRVAQAEAALVRALEVDPALAAAHNNLGRLAEARGEKQAARERYRAALGLDPELCEARFNLANLAAADGDLSGAVDGWERAVLSQPDFADAHFNLGVTLLGSPRASATERARARFHLLRYLELDAQGAWADRARALLIAVSRSAEPAPLGPAV